MLGAVKLKPPIIEDDLIINHGDTDIPQLDGNCSLDTLSLNQSNCNSCDYTYEGELSISQHTVNVQVQEQTWKKSLENSIPVMITTSFNSFEDPPPWYELYVPRNVNKNE